MEDNVNLQSAWNSPGILEKLFFLQVKCQAMAYNVNLQSAWNSPGILENFSFYKSKFLTESYINFDSDWADAYYQFKMSDYGKQCQSTKCLEFAGNSRKTFLSTSRNSWPNHILISKSD